MSDELEKDLSLIAALAETLKKKYAGLDSLKEIGKRLKALEGLLLTPEQLDGLERLLKHVDEIDPPPIIAPDFTVPDAENVKTVIFTDEKAPADAETTDISIEANGSVVSWYGENDTFYVSTQMKGLKINGEEDTLSRIFRDRGSYITAVEGLGHFDTGDTGFARSFEYMFSNYTALQSVDFTGVNAWAVQSFRGMFAGCSSLTEIKGFGDIETGNATDMSEMFSHCSALQKVDCSGVIMTEADDVSSMFDGCRQLRTIYAPEWAADHKSGINSDEMFANCERLPHYSPSKTDISNANWQEHRGYLTNPANKS